MDQRKRLFAAVGGAVALFLAVQVGALALVRPFEAAGYQTVKNPQDPTNSLLYVGVLLVMTAAMLAVIKLGRERVLRYFIVGTGGLISWYVLSVLVPTPAALAGAGVVVVALLVHPEWYVIDTAGVLMGMGAAALFGISFGVLPAIILLSVLAVYDAISVYRTEHMLTLAEGVMDLKVPVLFVVPTTRGYSFLEQVEEREETKEALDAALPEDVDPEDIESVEELEEYVDLDELPDDVEATIEAAESTESSEGGESGDDEGVSEERPGALDRDAIFIGLGDAVMPTIMAASAAFFLDAPTAFGVEIPVLLSVVGTQLGLLALLRMVLRGEPHAGLPLLNGGAIGGYLLGALLSGYSLVTALGLGGYV
ncbi:presenilin family intramembrane aspartyl protease PSH [Halospeciosus flavus]|uniref:Presenilin family intramembrane aspartyl protease PSH n=1 Tax=Halospeciosus flavus TaxID=3032283 RepID=A0ABD5Z262_9EURY|nr:presenilin family intramembrane aspartyl protease PSH [Halospeciosus flavus]